MGGVVIAALAGVGACCASCFGGLVSVRREEDLGIAILILAAVGLATFITVVTIHTRMNDAKKRNAMTNCYDQFASESDTEQEGDTDDTRQ